MQTGRDAGTGPTLASPELSSAIMVPSWWSSLVVVPVVTVALAACGSDEGADELTFADWQERTTAVCNDYEPQVQALLEQQPEITSAQDLVDLIEAIAPLNIEYSEALIDVGVPNERSGEIETLYDDLKAQEDLAMEIRSTAADDGLEAAAPALQRLGSSVESVNQRAQELGVPACDST